MLNWIKKLKSVYEEVPVLENEKYLLRFVLKEDAVDLLKIYSDKKSLPFFNSDNCHGDNFYYPTIEQMNEDVKFWLDSYKSKWFVRWVIIEKDTNKIIGSIELFHRTADDFFNHAGVLRLDLGSNYETAEVIECITSLIVPAAYDLFDTDKIITKIPLYAVERKSAFEKLGFINSEEFLIGTIDKYAYKDYWEKLNARL